MSLKISRLELVVAGLALVALCGSSCVGYRLGTTLPAGIETVYVPTFVNVSGEPLLETEATRATLQEFQKDGTLRTVDRQSADLVLSVRITGFNLEPLRYQDTRVRTAEEYRMLITAQLSVTDTRSETVLTERVVNGEITFVQQGDLTAAKRAALPEAAEDLAHSIVESVVEYW
jgi:hypothetical protein